jgi:dTDP-glucose 4,6-dehydratase
MKVAVLGSTSFSGSDFIDLLLDDPDCRVLGISRSEERHHPVFLPHMRHGTARYAFRQLHLVKDMPEILDALDSFAPDYVVNFAAQGEVRSSFEHPEAHFQTNTLAVARLCEALRQRSYLKKYVHISTPEVYGTCERPAKEDQPFNPSSPYAASKAAADMFTAILFRSYGFPVCLIRSTNVYGPHQQLYRIMPRTIIYGKLSKILKLDGGGKAIKSYIHIRDISRGERLVMLKGRPGAVYHLAPDEGVSIRRVVENICARLGVDFAAAVEETPERRGQDQAYLLDSTQARSELDWSPRISLDEGICGMVDWIEDNWNAIRELPLDYEFRP